LNIAKFGSILPNLAQYSSALEQLHHKIREEKKHCYIHPDVIIELSVKSGD
jgi:hypothetical protein